LEHKQEKGLPQMQPMPEIVQCENKIRFRRNALSIAHFQIIHRKGIPSTTLSLYLGLSQSATWDLMQKSRNIFGIHKNGYVFRKKTIEADEEYVGGAEGAKHAKKKLHGD
jgi:hypothetical protein